MTGHVPQEQIRTPPPPPHAGYPPCPAPQGSREARKTPWKPPRGGDGPEGLGENRSRAHEDAPLPSRQSPWDGPTGAGDRRRSSPGGVAHSRASSDPSASALSTRLRFRETRREKRAVPGA